MAVQELSKLHWFYHTQITEVGVQSELDEVAFKHCVQALRHQTGDQIAVTDGEGRLALAVLRQANKKIAVIELQEIYHIKAPKASLTLAVAMTKNANRNEWMLEKLTEMGVSDIVPLHTHRAEKWRTKEDRYERIIISAMLQSQQCYLPRLHATKDLEDVLKEEYKLKLIAHCLDDAEKLELKNIDLQQYKNAILLIGPEGDFTEEEIQKVKSQGYKAVTLGETRLRTETAAMVGAACLLCR